MAEIAKDYQEGLRVHEYRSLSALLDKYYEIEKLFSGLNSRDEGVILQLREDNKDDLSSVVNIALSHSRVGAKNNLILAILEQYQQPATDSSEIATYIRPSLKKIVELDSRSTSKVVLKAREILIQCALPSLKERSDQLEHILKSSVIETTYGEVGLEHCNPNYEVVKDVIDSKYVVFDVLTQFFVHSDRWVSFAALEVYIRRAYRAYSIVELNYNDEPGYSPAIFFKFMLPSLSQAAYNAVPQALTSSNGTKSHAMGRAVSVSDLSFLAVGETEPLRLGAICPAYHLDDVEVSMSTALDLYPRKPQGGLIMNTRASNILPRRGEQSAEKKQLSNVLTIPISNIDGYESEGVLLKRIKEIIDFYKEDLEACSIRRITFLLGDKIGSYPKYYTFKGPNYIEDTTIRHIEPSLAYQLELGRLSNFNIKPVFTDNRNIHVYEAVGKNAPTDKRFFTRGIVRTGKIRDDISTAEYLISEADRLMSDILDALEVIGTTNSDLNHIFINFSAVFSLLPEEVEAAFGGFLERFGRRLWRLRVTSAEIRIMCTDPSTGIPYPLRAMINNVSGYVVKSEMYMEVKNAKGEWVFKSIGKPGSMHLRSISTPYPTKESLQPKRYKAHLMGTTYCYDFPELFKQAVESQWKKLDHRKIPEDFFDFKELILEEGGELIEMTRDNGANNIGMVAWMINAKTPEYPRGRQIIVIANDITFKIGSFGPQEDNFFCKVTELARELGIPRIYLSANSGARIGVADELVPLFSVAWKDPEDSSKGFDYLYLTPEVKASLDKSGKKSVLTERIVESGEERHKIVTIIGAEDGLGVECLRGSGLIAGATSRAYKDIFTITLVTCRSVGIGAYLVRLGQRAIQIEGQPIILTGAPAINKLLGREVYTSNLQLGGTQIMYRNGVSHLTASDDLAGVEKIIEWLSYIPARKHMPIPVFETGDSWDREVEYTPTRNEAYDVRWMIAGRDTDTGFESGLFDKGSFQETLSGWAKGVVVGRARLGGIPFGVIGVETRTVDNLIPADPANPDSTEQALQEAGQVWYPNSAYKTAQAINDFNNGEELPLMILANWRGFSGGQRDMYNEVLKYGSYIVDALVDFKQPILTYIPPTGELRGGSWVVVDPTINADMMEMYADEESRAGVLEPEGMVGIKYRKEKLLATMQRLDTKYGQLKAEAAKPDLTPKQSADLVAKIKERENLLLPIYAQVSIQFADLHDRVGRMEAKGVIRKALKWKESRRFFFWRIRRRLNEEYLLRRIQEELPNSNRLERMARLKAWLPIDIEHENDRVVASWFEDNHVQIDKNIQELKNEAIRQNILGLLRKDKKSTISGIKDALHTLSKQERDHLIKSLDLK